MAAFLPLALPLLPAHLLWRTPQEGRSRQWLLGLFHWELRWAHFPLSFQSQARCSLCTLILCVSFAEEDRALEISKYWLFSTKLSSVSLSSVLSGHFLIQLLVLFKGQKKKNNHVGMVLVLTGLWTLGQQKRSHLYKLLLWWLHMSLIIRTGRLGTQSVSVPRPGEAGKKISGAARGSRAG